MAYKDTVQNFWVNSAVDKFEDKITNTGAIDTFRLDTPNLIPNIAEIEAGRVNPNQILDLAVFKKNEQSTGTVRTLVITGVEGTSALMDVTFGTITYDIVLSPAIFAGNKKSFQEALMKEMLLADMAMARKADLLAIASLEASKTLKDNTGGYPLPFSTGVYTASNAQKDDVLSYAAQILSVNEFESDQINVIGSPEMMSYAERLSQFAQYNSQNKAIVFQGKNIRLSNRLARGTDNQFSLFAMPIGSLAVIPYVEFDARNNTKTDIASYYQAYFPRLGYNVGVYEKFAPADRSGIDGAGFEHAAQYQLQFAIDLAFVTPYNSDTANITNAIHKIVTTVA